MKIQNIRFDKIDLPLVKPFRVALGTINKQTNVIVWIETDDGYVGIGEAAPFQPVTGENVDHIIAALKILRPLLLGQDATCIERIHNIMDAEIIYNSSAKAAIDIALFDILGKRLGQPLYKVLGGASNSVLTDMTIGMGEIDEMIAEAKEWVAAGFSVLKIKVGEGRERDIATVAGLREALGHAVRMRLDANQAWSRGDARYILRHIERYGIEAVEQPLPHYDVEGMAELRTVSSISIMADEAVHVPSDALRIVDSKAADLVNIKLMKAGGLLPALKINTICEAANIRCMVGCMVESRISITAAASLVAAQRNITEADVDSFMYFKDDTIRGGFEVTGGKITLSEEPGLGIVL